MTHLRIEQNNGVIEEVNSSVITKLYEIVHAGLDASSNLLGRLHSPVGIRSLILELTTTYPNLYINVDDYAIEFEDPKVVTYLNSIGVGSNGIVTESLAAAATVVANSQNTEITKFNELRYFTNITTSKGGWNSNQSGSIRFKNWTALEEIDISNFTSLGHIGNNYDDTFLGCTSLKKVTTNGNLTKIGNNAFSGCSNLEQITGLSGDILVSLNAFENCTKLPLSTIQNCTFSLVGTHNENASNGAFANTRFTLINLSDSVDFIPAAFCKNNNQLQSITGGTITYIRNNAFELCSSLTSFDFSNVEQIDALAFMSCDLTGTLSIPNLKALTGGHIFRDNRHLSAVNIDWSNLTNSGPTSNIFTYCTALSTIDLTGATAIGDGAFLGCSNLTTVTGLSDCETIGTLAFLNCNHLTTIDLSNVTQVGFRAFENCTSLTSLGATTFPGLTSLRAACFSNCTNLTGELNFPDLTNFPYENGYRGSLFYHCKKLTKITLGHITLLNYGAGTLTGVYAFEGCSALLTLDLGDSLTAINNHLFNGCDALRSVIIRATTPPTCTGASEGIARFFGNENVKIYVPDAVVNDYKADSGWSNIASYIYGIKEFPGEWEFVDKTFSVSEFLGASFTSVIIKGNTTYIPNFCFNGCTNLTEVVLPSTCVGLAEGAFGGCSNLEKVNLDSIQYMDLSNSDIFGNCLKLRILNYQNLLNPTGIALNNVETTHNYQNKALYNYFIAPGATDIYLPKFDTLIGGRDDTDRTYNGWFCGNGWYRKSTGNTNTPAWNTIYLRDVTTVGKGAFCGCDIVNLVINSDTVPNVVDLQWGQTTYNGKLFEGNHTIQHIYVKPELVNDFKNDTYWGEKASIIESIANCQRKTANEVLAGEVGLVDAWM